MHIDIPKRHFASEFKPHHDHSGYPEENNIKAGDQYAGGVKSV